MGALACTDTVRVIDAFPISVDLDSGAVVAAASFGSDADPVPVVIDTLSPVTILDPGADAPITRRRVELTLFAVDADGSPTVPRARFPGTRSYELHPCAEDAGCTVGPPAASVAFDGVVGFDVLGTSGVTIDFFRGTLELSPDIAGRNTDRRAACEAEFPAPFAGGGTLRIGNDVQLFEARRPAIRTCLSHGLTIGDGDDGTDVLLILSTGTPLSLLSEAGYQRYRAALPSAPPLSDLPSESVAFITGTRSLPIAEIPRMALVGQAQGERGACREIYASRVMEQGGCDEAGVRDCPCPEEQDRFCRAGASILLGETVRFGIVPDGDPLLQALRDELRPAFPEVDGLLSPAALGNLRVAFDYPGTRMFMRCENPGPCETRPVIASPDPDRSTCLLPPDAGPVP